MMKVEEVGLPDEPAGVAFYRWLRDVVLTEENTDKVIDVVVDALPIPSVVSRWVLDQIMPGALLTAARKALQSIGQLPSDRYLHELNPFTRYG